MQPHAAPRRARARGGPDRYGARQLAQVRGALAQLEVIRDGACVVGRAPGWPGWEAEFRWTDQRGLRLRQHQVSVARPDPPPHAPDSPGRVLTWTATALAAHYADYAEAFAAVLASVHLIPPPVVIRVPRG